MKRRTLCNLLLLGAMLFCVSSASAIEVELVTNGNLEGTDFSSFLAKEAPAVEAGAVTVVEGEGVDGSRAIKVCSADKPANTWDTQFWIKLAEPLQEGTIIHVQFNYRAAKNARVSTEAHGTFAGDYNDWHCLGDIDFTTSWEFFNKSVLVSADMVGENEKGMQFITFTLSKFAEANEYYFDNISVTMDDGTIDPSIDPHYGQRVVNGDLEGTDFNSFRVRDVTTNTEMLVPTNTHVIVDPLNGENHCLKLVAHANPENTWDSQFFVIVGDAENTMRYGDAFRFSMRVRSSLTTKISSQVHAAPGSYLDWHCVGDFYPTTEWQTWSYEGEVGAAEQNNFYTIAFNLCEQNPEEEIEFYFDDISFEKLDLGGGPIINFKDENTKAFCVKKWDKNKDGELSELEAAFVKKVNDVFYNSNIGSFDEFQYFTGVTDLHSYTFDTCPNLTSVTIPASVTNISSFLISDCPNLTSIKVAAGNKYYDSRDNCNAIIRTVSEDEESSQSADQLVAGCKTTVIPATVTSIGNGAFYYCLGLTSFTIPTPVIEVGYAAFYGCQDLTTVVVGKSVTSIQPNAFAYCPITSLTVDEENPVYDSRDNCNAIIDTKYNMLRIGCRTTVIPNTVATIGGSAFYGCRGLTTIDIPASVRTIIANAFMYCDDLTSMVIPSTVWDIYGAIFKYCYNLTSITVAEDNPYYDSRDNCNAIINTENNKLICACNATVIPGTVQAIGYSAFEGCTMELITIPGSVTNIENYAFNDMTLLTEVVVKSSVPCPIAERSFYHNIWGRAKTLYVPKGSLEAYQTDPYWGQFPAFVEYPLGDADGNGEVTIADAVAIWNHILNPSSPLDMMFADMNGDGKITITDAVALVMSLVQAQNE